MCCLNSKDKFLSYVYWNMKHENFGGELLKKAIVDRKTNLIFFVL